MGPLILSLQGNLENPVSPGNQRSISKTQMIKEGEKLRRINHLGQTYRETCNPRRTLKGQKTGQHECSLATEQDLSPGTGPRV